MAFLEMTDLQKDFGATRVVKDFNLAVEQGEFVSFLGPSGCGKTTTLRMVAGFETPTAGRILIGGRDVTNVKPSQRNIGMVFQAYALFPNLTVAQNVAFGLEVAGESRTKIAARVKEMLAIIKLPEHGDRYPFQLSGGQQQRVALARALAVKPQVLLLDEPLSALDAKIRISLREEIRSIQKELGITTIYVTHDQEEALSMSDRIVVMHDGVAQQIGTPFEVYNRPATRFVASFVGTLNVLRGAVADPAKGTVRVDQALISLGGPLNGRNAGEAIALALRPEAVSIGRRADRRNSVDGTIEGVSFLGSVIRVRVKLGGNSISLDTFNDPAAPPPVPGQRAEISFAPADALVLPD